MSRGRATSTVETSAKTGWRRTQALRAGLAVALLGAGLSAGIAETQIARGRYLATIAACVGCHTPRAADAAVVSGGVRFGVGPQAIVSANLTPDRDTGIGTWTDHQIAAAIRLGVRPDGTRIGPPMPQRAYGGLSDADVDAIVAFLRSVPAIHNPVAPSNRTPMPLVPPGTGTDGAAPVDGRDPAARGRYLFEAVAHCAECHRPGRAFPGPHGGIVAPSLTPTGLSRFSDAELAQIVTRGLRPDGSKLAGPMPVAAFAHLTPDDLAAIIGYMRGSP